jgi:hypothetical protein
MQNIWNPRELFTVSFVERFVIELLSASRQMNGSWYIRETVDKWPRIFAQGVQESSLNDNDGQGQHDLRKQSVIAATRLFQFYIPELG